MLLPFSFFFSSYLFVSLSSLFLPGPLRCVYNSDCLLFSSTSVPSFLTRSSVSKEKKNEKSSPRESQSLRLGKKSKRKKKRPKQSDVENKGRAAARSGEYITRGFLHPNVIGFLAACVCVCVCLNC